MTIDVSREGRIHSKSQVVDYRYRGAIFEQMNVIDFFTCTYEEKLRGDLAEETVSDSQSVNPRRGRPKHARGRYMEEHPFAKTKQRVLRSSTTHNILPNFIGQYFPRKTDSAETDFYSASMLLLLKPW